MKTKLFEVDAMTGEALVELSIASAIGALEAPHSRAKKIIDQNGEVYALTYYDSKGDNYRYKQLEQLP